MVAEASKGGKGKAIIDLQHGTGCRQRQARMSKWKIENLIIGPPSGCTFCHLRGGQTKKKTKKKLSLTANKKLRLILPIFLLPAPPRLNHDGWCTCGSKYRASLGGFLIEASEPSRSLSKIHHRKNHLRLGGWAAPFVAQSTDRGRTHRHAQALVPGGPSEGEGKKRASSRVGHFGA